uniref:PIPK domain-containing protein n=1 Tax=Spongospora subterranea TaxID=70186 RepID=A0A0H5R7D1_9EUKA|eukprot:CRZ09721.1 hypothetical protein [Spongospora subterranea]
MSLVQPDAEPLPSEPVLLRVSVEHSQLIARAHDDAKVDGVVASVRTTPSGYPLVENADQCAADVITSESGNSLKFSPDVPVIPFVALKNPSSAIDQLQSAQSDIADTCESLPAKDINDLLDMSTSEEDPVGPLPDCDSNPIMESEEEPDFVVDHQRGLPSSGLPSLTPSSTVSRKDYPETGPDIVDAIPSPKTGIVKSPDSAPFSHSGKLPSKVHRSIPSQPAFTDFNDIQLEIQDVVEPLRSSSIRRSQQSEYRRTLASGSGINLVVDAPSTINQSDQNGVNAESISLERPSISHPESRTHSISPSAESKGRHSRSRVSQQVSEILHKISAKKGISISDRSHPEFELTCDMMLGIRHTVGRAAPAENTIAAKHFKETVSYLFPHEGSSSTPAHPLSSFKFKDYQPAVYRSLRRRFGIDTADYLLCLCGDEHYLEFIANSKSGQFFFYSHDRQFMIKTITNSEAKFLQSILARYYKYVMDNPNTLLTSFLGMHRVKPHKMKKMHFVIMGSVFYTDKFIHEVYDIKGSTLGRKATEAEKCQETPVLKDVDFIDNNQVINIGPKNGSIFLRQLQDDAKFLKKLKIMDYSLLLGIHRVDSDALKSTRSNEDAEKHRRRQSNYGLKTWQQIVCSPQWAFEDLPEETVKDRAASTRDLHLNLDTAFPKSVFRLESGGVASVDVVGQQQKGNRIFFMGIIDILQRYNTKKMVEHHWKTIKYDKNTISAVNPTIYCNRFLEFLKRAAPI